MGLRGKVGIRPCITFPQTPLKFRTAGFPQYGFKPAVGGHLRPRGLIGAPESFRCSLTIAQRAIAALCRRRGELRPDTPAQRPLARRRVMLSRRVNAYYGLIRASGPLRVAYGFAGRSLPRGRGPGGPCFTLRILPSVPPSVPRQTGRPKDDSTSARDSLRPNARGSASAKFPLESVHVGCPFEAAKFA